MAWGVICAPIFVYVTTTVADKKNVAFFTSKKKLFRLNKSI